MQRKHIVFASLVLFSYTSFAQVPEDALRMSWTKPTGTARAQAIGGAITSLGGDISSVFVNPAGLGFYKTGEFVFSPGFSFFSGKGDYFGTSSTADKLTRFNINTTGLVLGGKNNRYSKWTNSTFSLALSRTADFNGTMYYKGRNNYSSFTENPANEFFNFYTDQKNQNPGLSDLAIVNNAIDDPAISLLTKMGLYTYLIDIDSSGAQKRIVSRAEEVGDLFQENKVTTKGGITEFALGFAGNKNDRFYIGASLGIPVVNYKRNSSYTETDATGNNDNNFNYARYTEEYSSKGAGINAKVGIIVKPADRIRLGLAIHSPTFYTLKEEFSARMVTDVENLLGAGKGLDSVNASTFYGNRDPNFRYSLSTPFRFMLGGSYIFNEVADVTQQKGFVSFDVEYVNYGWNRFSSSDYYDDDSYYEDVNTATKNIYKGAFNYRLGGELKFNTIMARAGFAYLSSPYKDDVLKGDRMNISGGLGYRNKGMFVDLTYTLGLNKDVNFPYRVDAPSINYFADVKQTSNNVLLTVGFKF